ncbi:MAG: hypothetical protein J5970_04885 [Bacilli bacterium]|nr:hypothetical protein [Bacilli bacterium]
MFFQILFSNFLLNLKNELYIPKKIYNFLNISKEEFIIILLSIFSGYPNNIRLLKNSNNEYLNYSTNFVNPLFILVNVGLIYLHNIKLASIIYLSHIIANIIILFLFKKKNKSNNNLISINYSYSELLKNTISTLSIIFSNILFISLFIALIKLTIPFNSYIIGILEFSRGIYEISNMNITIYLKGLLILIIITFGSFSIHFQVISLNEKIKYIKYLLFRILNVLISIFIYFIFIYIIYL